MTATDPDDAPGVPPPLHPAEVVALNRHITGALRGVFLGLQPTLVNPRALEHILDTLDATLFGQPIYPTLFDKAAALAIRIITGHVFHDGNKRTAIAAAALLLDRAGFQLAAGAEEAAALAARIAASELTPQAVADWLRQRTHPTADASEADIPPPD